MLNSARHSFFYSLGTRDDVDDDMVSLVESKNSGCGDTGLPGLIAV